MFSLDVQTRRMLAQDRIDSLAGPRRRRSAVRNETLPVRATYARAAAVPPSTAAARPHSNPA
jgi:hypothetical protein